MLTKKKSFLWPLRNDSIYVQVEFADMLFLSARCSFIGDEVDSTSTVTFLSAISKTSAVFYVCDVDLIF